MFERFTDRARQVVILADKEARALRYAEVGNGHILLGLAAEDGGVASQALAALGLDPDAARAALCRIVRPVDAAPTGHMPLSQRAKKTMEHALREALALGHNYIGTEHLLLGLLRDAEGPADQMLTAAGIAPIVVRDEVLRRLGSYEAAAAAPAAVPDEIRKAAHDAATLPFAQYLKTSPRQLIDLALDAAAPLIRADEHKCVAAALRRAMGDNDSLHLCRHMLDGHSCGGRTLADLLGEDGQQ